VSLLGGNPRYRRYFVARFSSVTGSTVAPLALAFAVLNAGGGATALGVVLVTGPVIYMVLSPVAGVLADRLPRIAIIIASQMVSGLSQAVSAVLVLTGAAEVWELALLALLSGAAGAFFQPAVQGLVPQIVAGSVLVEANALLQLANNSVAIIGPAVAGTVIAVAGPGWVLLWDALTFAISAILFATLRVPAGRRERPRLWTDLRDGWSAFASRGWLLVLTIQLAITSGAWAAGISVLGPVYAKQYLDGPVAWGLVGSATGIGLAIGSVASLLLRPTRVGLIMCGAVVPEALLLAGMAAGMPLPMIATAAVATGAAGTFQLISWNSFLQRWIPDQEFSRVIATSSTIATVLVPVAYAAVGPLTAAVGVRPVLWGCTVICLAAAIASVSVADVRQLSNQPGFRCSPQSLRQP
jgi:MFS family permease